MMRQTWRWFGPSDAIPLRYIRQAGVEGIVTALYDLPPGTEWPVETLLARKAQIEAAGMTWDVVESLPVTEAIKTGGPKAKADTDTWINSLRACHAAGLRTICYNFMPILDWTRTDLAWPRPDGARALRFDLVDFAAFDLRVLGRDGTYAPEVTEAAMTRGIDPDRLTATILAGLPGAMEAWTLDSFRTQLMTYADVGEDGLRANLAAFLQSVVPVAEDLGMRLCCHPDDPPWPLFGLPRIVSTEADYLSLLAAAPSPANGITFCTGSLGARPDVDLPGMAQRLGPHIHFAHLRNVRREAETIPTSFFEDAHLEGSTDMIAVIRALLAEQARRAAAGREDAQIPMRPDHGQMILDDHTRDTAPGYPAIGRLRGLAELRGAMAALV
ncbi:mannonate dehydratase [Jannaschia pagri]|uniref:Mannonate dehydratase n=2 Tax=Roseobacteraceae TaxID=2854170 RepID=A0ABQ4NMH4_9RHOB|nr:mannonate dehydratase [Jannaschia sp. AI_61]GIT95445.1 mannonate dehydratase [Jannaschia sp. AI_62]